MADAKNTIRDNQRKAFDELRKLDEQLGLADDELAANDMVVPDEFRITWSLAPVTQNDFVPMSWLGTPEGLAAQAQHRANMVIMTGEQEELMMRNSDVEMYESGMWHMQPYYGLPGTQLMLF